MMTWSVENRICMVTGANSGIGKTTALGLAKLGATVTMVCRDRGRGEEAMADIKKESGNDSIDLMIADLASQESIHQLAKDFKDRHQQLHVLINNAAVNLIRRSLTVDGIETTFAINHLAPFLLTHLLLDVLRASAPARIVNVTSSGHSRTMDFDNLQGKKQYSMSRTHSQSKLANILFTYELARRLEGTGVTANCVHPGVVKTNLGRDARGMFRIVLILLSPFVSNPERGAETSIHVASSPEIEGVSGKYFIKKKPAKSAEVSYDEAVSKRLWQISAQMASLI